MTFVESPAGAAVATSSAINASVGTIEGVPSLAGSLRCVCRLKCVAAQEIHPARYGLKVVRVYTEGYAAEVVKREAVGDGAFCAFPCETVSAYRLVGSQCEVPVPVGAVSGSPEPALTEMGGVSGHRSVLVDLRPEPLGDILFGPWANPEIDRSITMHSHPFVMRSAEPASPDRFSAISYRAPHVQKYTIHGQCRPC